MIAVTDDVHYAACRFGILAQAGGKPKRDRTVGLTGHSVSGGKMDNAEVLEFRTAGGEVLSRKVTALGGVACWLRRDLAEAAMLAMAAEAAENQRVISSLGDFIRETDLQGARRNGMTVEQYRAKRHADGMQWDKYRAKQRAGGF